MKNIDRIRNYILERKACGELRPGGKLPPYNVLTEQFHISYQTVFSILNKLEKEGLVEIRKGSGSYLTGASRLKVLINIQATTVSVTKMRKLLNKHLANSELYLDFDIQPMLRLADSREQQRARETYKAAVSIQPVLVNEQQLPPAPLSQFADYASVMRGLHTVREVNYEYCIPFTFHTYQIGVNCGLLKKVGFELKDLTPDFRWWDSFVKNCRKVGIRPASVDYVEVGPLFFREFSPLLLCFSPYEENRYQGDRPLFNTPEGERFLSVVKDTEMITDTLSSSESFYQNGAVFGWRCGSWLTVQNHSPERPDKTVNDLAFLPYRTEQGEKISVFDPECLMAYMRYDITQDERNRIWELMKIMVSREFQMDYCGLGGVVSANRDVLPTEYLWNRHNDNANFFPDNPEKVVFPRTFFTMSQISMLSLLLENWKFYGAPAEETLRRMDLKKRFYRTNIPEKTIMDQEEK